MLNWTGPNGFSSTSTVVQNLEPGEYYLTASITGGCTSTTEVFEITEPDQLALTIINACGTTIEAQVSGGTGDYDYTVSNEETGSTYTYFGEPGGLTIPNIGTTDITPGVNLSLIHI